MKFVVASILFATVWVGIAHAEESDRLLRVEHIRSCHFNRPQIEAPANVPLTIEMIIDDSRPVTVRSTDLGLLPRHIIGTRTNTLTHPYSITNAPRTEMDLGPLKAGSYVVSGVCGATSSQVFLTIH